MSSNPGNNTAQPTAANTANPVEPEVTSGNAKARLPAANQRDCLLKLVVSIFTSSTASVSDSIREYRELHGRSFTQKTEYWGPNDEQQNDALDFNHFWLTNFFDGRLFLAPIGDNPQNILDIGTGTGIWAIDFADEYPSADVIGVDISPIQPSWVPPNCRFQIDDFEKDWTFNHGFDFIHARNLEGCISDLPRLFEQCFTYTKPGGWFEILEFDIEVRSQSLGDLDEDHIFKRWHQHMLVSSVKMGKPHGNAVDRKLTKAMINAGYVDVVERKWPIPIGTWPAMPEMKRLGSCTLDFLEQSLEGFGLFLLKEILGFTYEEVQVTLAELRSALRNPKNTPLYYLHVVYGRKPEKAEGDQ
ncbi:methyltransferase domain-containing protein [Colletotrichum higginsianum IMI 349063]|uniref:Methyltransferase domain-containing protein n=1 Tax=Colletotrichum higginsianum (strain IMI 349063) TaxID=759273 RepID=A0A1B7YR36_COLHI|nr:methyltransferase domain-containing protein [Colletotrichum higginsianum IMI 349063]OBR14510.1 methyltransferase domain-containing protein [Colletotrichum higginsianum IMI 349063]